jgi:uncharacterized delta-60 repeat protein
MVIGGEFKTVKGTACGGLALLNTDGSVNSGFAAQLNGAVTAVQVLTNGLVFVAGSFTMVNGTRCGGLACLKADGSLNSSFVNGTNRIADGCIGSLVVQPDGKVLVGGQFWHVQGHAIKNLARLETDGSLDLGFQPGFGDSSVCVYALTLDHGGSILVGGFFEQVQGAHMGAIIRLAANGVLDRAFRPGFHGIVQDVLLQPDNKILLAGEMSSAIRPFHNLARLNPDGSLEASFDCPWATEGLAIEARSRQGDGDILIGGAFTEVNSLPQPYLARLRGRSTGNLGNGGIPLCPGYLAILPPCQGGQNWRLQVWGKPGRDYRIEASSNLKDWSPIGVGTSSTGALEFTDVEGSGLPHRFYRARSEEGW